MLRSLLPFVLLSASLGEACAPRTCQVNSQCSSGEICLNQICVPGSPPEDAGPFCPSSDPCTRDSDCSGGACQNGCCAAVTCSSDNDCLRSQTCIGGVCQTNTVDPGCTADGDCPSGQTCMSGTCVAAGCTSNSDCGSGQTCVAGTCTGCTTRADCSSGQFCVNGVCLTVDAGSAGCAGNGDCAATPATPDCDTGTGLCVQCLTSSECSSGETCTNGNCVSSAGGCTADAQCSATPATPHCNPATNVCVACVTDGNCGATEACIAFSCVSTAGGACMSDSNCVQGSADPVCDTALGQCVECVGVPSAACGTAGLCQNDVCLIGCNDLVTCLSDCSTFNCQASCIASTTPLGKMLYEDLYTCVFVDQCPNTGGGICDPTAQGYNAMNCNVCAQIAQTGLSGNDRNAPCYNDLELCVTH